MKIIEGSAIGGVTLNHLAWYDTRSRIRPCTTSWFGSSYSCRATALGVPTALMTLQGDDDVGREIRAEMKRHGISTNLIDVRGSFAPPDTSCTMQCATVFVGSTKSRFCSFLCMA